MNTGDRDDIITVKKKKEKLTGFYIKMYHILLHVGGNVTFLKSIAAVINQSRSSKEWEDRQD